MCQWSAVMPESRFFASYDSDTRLGTMGQTFAADALEHLERGACWKRDFEPGFPGPQIVK